MTKEFNANVFATIFSFFMNFGIMEFFLWVYKNNVTGHDHSTFIKFFFPLFFGLQTMKIWNSSYRKEEAEKQQNNTKE